MTARTLYDKIWDEHVVHTEEGGTSVPYIDRHPVHEGTSPEAFEGLRLAGGEEKDARRIARAIVAARTQAPIATTVQLAEMIRGAVRGAGKMKIHPATRSFQALRIEVNQELAELEEALVAAEQLLKPGGRLVVVTFHSLEDSMVKQFMLRRSNADAAPSRHSPAALRADAASQLNTFILTPKQAIAPTEEEVNLNPRARSAKLRCATPTASPWNAVAA